MSRRPHLVRPQAKNNAAPVLGGSLKVEDPRVEISPAVTPSMVERLAKEVEAIVALVDELNATKLRLEADVDSLKHAKAALLRADSSI